MKSIPCYKFLTSYIYQGKYLWKLFYFISKIIHASLKNLFDYFLDMHFSFSLCLNFLISMPLIVIHQIVMHNQIINFDFDFDLKSNNHEKFQFFVAKYNVFFLRNSTKWLYSSMIQFIVLYRVIIINEINSIRKLSVLSCVTMKE